MRVFITLFSITFLTLQLSSQQGTVIENLKLESNIMGEAVEYCVYLPPDYNTSERSYPVVYLLHGYSDDETGWVQFGQVNRIVSEGIHSGEVAPMVIVMPDGGVTWYVNDVAGKKRWADMFVEEFIPHVESAYRIRGARRFRGIAGLSMGGHGALIHSMKRPDLFSGCAAFSAGIWTEEDMTDMPIEDYNNWFAHLYGEREEGDPMSDHFRDNAVIYKAKNAPVDSLNRVAFWLDCGDDDFLTVVNARLHIIFEERGITHEYRVRDGAHTWSYWRSGLVPALQYLSGFFRQ